MKEKKKNAFTMLSVWLLLIVLSFLFWMGMIKGVDCIISLIQ